MRSPKLVLTMEREFLCFAHGDETGWEALCVDLNIAIQGATFDEVQEQLERAVASYIKDALAEDEDTCRKLLSRMAPWHVTAGLTLKLIWERLKNRRKRIRQASFPIYAAPQMHVPAIS